MATAPVLAQAPDSARQASVHPQPEVLLVPRISVAGQPKAFVGAGVSRLNMRMMPGNKLRATGQYLAADVRVAGRGSWYGVRLGAFATWRLLCAEASAGYYTNGRGGQLILTPALGLSGGGMLNLLYGYNASLGGAQLAQASRHRVSLAWHLLPM
ncbi:hypothetical protein D3Y59_15560 [Hymenobacter oligotrophus]|uniref:Outer membrane protein beta-barrel domain-containing protein n=1 Tax=Hymenobacter oligotrophus TaxID=2319843 RepID=A0A3B7R2M5_9BACT|nr:hypothetical protein D3Y59_15560 [Hymenobacter oligotrophus]